MTDHPIRYYEFHRWLNPFRRHEFVMVTPLPRSEIAKKLDLHIVEKGRFHGLTPFFFGISTPTTLELTRIGLSKLSRPMLTGDYEDVPAGTLLFFNVSLQRRDAIVSIIVLPILIVLSSLGWAAVITSRAEFLELFVPFIATVLLLLYFIDRWISRNEDNFYRQFLSDALMAEDLESADGP